MRMCLFACCLVAAVLGTSNPAAADVLSIDTFDYSDDAAAQEAWQPGPRAEPVQLWREPGNTIPVALRLPCNFSPGPQQERVYFDRPVELDLTQYGTIEFDFYVEDPGPIRNGNIYFRAGNGWYGAGFPAERGWNRVRLGKAAFRPEGQPAGWGAVDAIRIGLWKSRPQETFAAIAGLQARSEPIVVVAGGDDRAEAQAVREVAERVGNLLAAAGIPHGVHSRRDVEAGALEGRRLAIFAYSPRMQDAEAQRVREFLDGGGRAVFFYTIRGDLASQLGLARLRYRSADPPDAFSRVVFDSPEISGLPEAMYQGSWNITSAAPASEQTQVIGWWQDAQGQRGDPAVLINERGAFMGHILTGEDLPSKQAFLLALIGHFEPWVWREAARQAVTGAMRIGPFADLDELDAFLADRGPETPAAERIAARREEARAIRERVQADLSAERYQAVIAGADEMRRVLADAYAWAHRPRDGEFRAVWNHSGTGDLDCWDEAMRRLAEANFNAVVPNMWWGGVAHYASDLLPRSRTFEERGDQIAQAVESGRRYGIEVHPWKVNYNLGRAPEDFVQKMRDQGRLQYSSSGEELAWLCPSHPDNQQLEIDTMVEVARNYDVDGIHFDYIRYPHEDACYCDGCRQRFTADWGRPVENWPRDCRRGPLRQAYRDWRCEQINRVVRETATQVRQIKPHVKISAAVFNNYPATKNSIGQDWLLWCREGWLDFVCPMNYTTSDSGFESMTAAQQGDLQGRVPLITGIGHWRMTDEQALGQVEIARRQGADGFILFNMGTSLAETCLPKFARARTSQPAVLPYRAPRIRFTTPADDDQPVVRIAGETLELTVHLVDSGHHRQPVTAIRGAVRVEDLAGDARVSLFELPGVGGQQSGIIAGQSGVFRVAAVGEMTFADGAVQPFIVRSRPYRFVSPAADACRPSSGL